MKTSLTLILALILLSAMVGCSRRMAPFSPHRSPNEAHLAATSNQQCLGCHDITDHRQHQPADNCLRCHRILPGG